MLLLNGLHIRLLNSLSEDTILRQLICGFAPTRHGCVYITIATRLLKHAVRYLISVRCHFVQTSQPVCQINYYLTGFAVCSLVRSNVSLLVNITAKLDDAMSHIFLIKDLRETYVQAFPLLIFFIEIFRKPINLLYSSNSLITEQWKAI